MNVQLCGCLPLLASLRGMHPSEVCMSTGWTLKGKHKARVDAGCETKRYGEEEPDYRGIMWSGDTLRKFSAIAVLAGVAAG